MLNYIKSLFSSSKNDVLVLTKEMMVRKKTAKKKKAAKKTAKRGRSKKTK
jgi:hypothetical protein